MRETSQITTFSFRYVRGGQAAFGKRQGVIGEALGLDDTEIPWEAVAETAARGDRLVLAFRGPISPGPRFAKFLVDGTLLAIIPTGLDAGQLMRAFDRRASAREAELRRQQLISEGKEHLVRTVTCPVCRATVDLSGLDATRYAYCRFCESLFGEDGKDVTDGRHYRTCGECGMFDRIQEYPEFYFYFLLVVYGFSYKKRYLCDSCAHRLFLKTLAINLIFLLGVPTAIWVKIKSVTGRAEHFARLAEGNALARGGRFRDAEALFARLLETHPEHPAILTNQALGHARGGDQTGAARALARALTSCNSYLPAIRMVQQPQQLPA